MRGIYSSVTDIRRQVFTEVARMAYEGGDYSRVEELPYKILPGEVSKYRDSIFLERAIVGERLRLSMGLPLRPIDEHAPLSTGIEEAARPEKYYEPPLINIIKFACNACPEKSFHVTDMCQGCLAHPCVEVCPKGAVSIVHGKSVIDQSKCVKCGQCANVCPYGAIHKMERPCAKACGMDAIGSDELGRAKIDYDKCVSCGMCLVNCPFGAIADKSQIFQVIQSINQGDRVIAAVAPAFVGQFGPDMTPEKLAFFALTKVIPLDMAVEDMKKNNYNSYFKKAGQKIVDLNDKAVDLGISAAVKVEIPASWADAPDTPMAEPKNASAFVRDIVLPMDRQQGDKLPVSVFQKHGVLDGTWENGTSAFSKRGVATKVPKWNAESCIQCNRCAMCCPHAAIRPVLLTEEEKAQVPASFETVPAKGLGKDAPSYFFRMQVSPYDCLGCGVCLTACPANQSDKTADALVMTPFEEMKSEQANFDEVAMNDKYLKKDVINSKTVKNMQFAKPYFQFSAACAGCAETTYIKLLSQMVGDRMYAGNAAGCSSAISGGAPILPYCKDSQGRGPAWEHSLFEDNAEFAYGFFHAQDAIRKELLIRLESMKDADIAPAEIEDYINNWNDGEKSRAVSDALIAALEKCEQTEDVSYILENREYLSKKSIWAIGGDGWAYDIGFGGIDHVMAQNRDVNLLVLDTEVYSNTGGQSSKSTPTSAVAKFAAGGKQVAKKDLGAILMTYGYVYVAQVAMGYDQAQTLKALREAESYPGPAIVICYCPCLEQHIKAGMSCTQDEMKKAVECGYWHLYRYDPRRIAEGKNPFQLDSPAPDTDKLMDFLMGENRFASLKNNFPERADALYQKEIADVKARYQKYRKMAED